jgi:hypothetical protein
MRIDDQIKALRGDPASQRRLHDEAEQAAARWRADALGGGILGDLKAFGEGSSLRNLAQLSSLLEDIHAARTLVDGFVERMASLLQANPFTLIPFRHNSSQGLVTLQLARSGSATLSLVVYEELGGEQRPSAVTFADMDRHEIVLRGRAEGHFHTRCARVGAVETRIEPLSQGTRLTSCGPMQTRQIVAVEGSLAILQLSRTPTAPALTETLRLSDGALLHQSCGHKLTSQHEMAIALLGEMGRQDALEPILAMTREGADHLRWEALRHALALDAAAGFQALSEIAALEGDALASPAQKLRTQLLHSHPELAPKELQPCPA